MKLLMKGEAMSDLHRTELIKRVAQECGISCIVPFDIGQDGRNSAAYRNWRRDVLARDGYCCQRCGDTSGPLHAHHIKSYADHPDLRFDESNGTTLCVFCHGVEHGRRIG